MAYASCRYVLSGADAVDQADHFVCEAIAMGLVPLAAFAPPPRAPCDVWDAHQMAAAFSAASRADRPTAPSAPVHMTQAAQAQCLADFVTSTARGRLWGTSGPLGLVQACAPSDVAAVRPSDHRALVAWCGVESEMDQATQAWLARCTYHKAAIMGPRGGMLGAAICQALQAEAAHLADVAAFVVWLTQTSKTWHGLGFDVVHIGAAAHDVLAMRRLCQVLDRPASPLAPARMGRLFRTASAQVAPAADDGLCVIACQADRPVPAWASYWHQTRPGSCIIALPDAVDAPLPAASAHVLRLFCVTRMMDGGAGARRIAAAWAAIGRPALPTQRPASHGRHLRAVDLADFAALDPSAARQSLGWPQARLAVVLHVPKLTHACAKELQALWPAIARRMPRASCAHVYVCIGDALPPVYAQLHAGLAAHDVAAAVTLLCGTLDPFAPARPDARPLSVSPMALGAADIYIDGPWSGPMRRQNRHAAMAARLPIIAWAPDVGVDVVRDDDADVDAETFAHMDDAPGIAFIIAQQHSDAMCQALEVYLTTLLIDPALRRRAGAKAYAHVTRCYNSTVLAPDDAGDASNVPPNAHAEPSVSVPLQHPPYAAGTLLSSPPC